MPDNDTTPNNPYPVPPSSYTGAGSAASSVFTPTGAQPHGASDTNNAGFPPPPPYGGPAAPDAPQPPMGRGRRGRRRKDRQPKPKKGHGWIVAIVAIVCVFILAAMGVSSCSRIVEGALGESSSQGASTHGDTIAVITLDGTISYDGSACSPEGLKSLLDQAADNDDIKGVVLRVNSGGGTATAGEEMAVYVNEFRQNSGKPVVVSSASMNASAAYEISSQADYIFVAKTTEIGAIGTIMQTYDLSELLSKLGVSVDNIASADSKDSTYGTRPLTDEERAYYQAMVDELNATFVQNVADGRGLSVEQVKPLATGLPFAGTTAVTNGIADEIGTLEDAEDKAAELAGASSDYNTISLDVNQSDLSSLAGMLGQSDQNDTNQALATLLKEQVNHGKSAE